MPSSRLTMWAPPLKAPKTSDMSPNRPLLFLVLLSLSIIPPFARSSTSYKVVFYVRERETDGETERHHISTITQTSLKATSLIVFFFRLLKGLLFLPLNDVSLRTSPTTITWLSCYTWYKLYTRGLYEVFRSIRHDESEQSSLKELVTALWFAPRVAAAAAALLALGY